MTSISRKKAYAKDGVDVEEEALFSKFAGSICKASYKNSPFVEVREYAEGQFRGPRPFIFKNLPKGFSIEASTDGIGTKGILIDAAKTHHLAAYDVIAMTASDITRFGGIPLVFVNVFDIVSVGEAGDKIRETYKKAIQGLGKVAKEAKLVLLKGETAQMGIAIGSEIKDSKTKLNWSGTMIGAYHKDKMITGETLRPGQAVIALKENGFRSNGLSAVRKALQAKFGKEWWKNPVAKGSVKQAAAPSVLYDLFLNTLHGWFNKRFESEIPLHAIVHLSGGAIKEKLANDLLFPRGLSAVLDDLWEPPMIMRRCAKWRGIDDYEFYETWNGGQGMLVVVDQRDVGHFLKKAKAFSVRAKVAGSITKEKKPRVVVHSQLTKNKKIVYNI